MRDALKAVEVGAYLMPPLIKDDRFIGAFTVHSRTPRVWTQDEIMLSREVADRVALALEQRRAEAALRAGGERLTFLLRLSDALRPLNDPLDVQEVASRLLGEYLDVTVSATPRSKRREYVFGANTCAVSPRLPDRDQAERSARRCATPTGVAIRWSSTTSDTDPRFTDDERLALQARQIESFVGVMLLRRRAAGGRLRRQPRDTAHVDADRDRADSRRRRTHLGRRRARRAPRRALREREQRLRLALDASAGGSWTWDAAYQSGRLGRSVSRAIRFPARRAAAIDAWLDVRVHEEDRPQVLGAPV